MFYNYPEEFLFQVIRKENFNTISTRGSRDIIEDEAAINSRKSKILETIDEEYVESLRNQLIMEGIQ